MSKRPQPAPSALIGLDIQANKIILNIYTADSNNQEDHRKPEIVPLPEGTIQDGQLLRPETLTQAIKDGLAALHTPIRQAVVSLPTASGLFITTMGSTVPEGADPADYLRTAMQKSIPELQTALNKKTHNYKIDRIITGPSTQYVIASAAKSTLSEYAMACTQAGLKVLDMELQLTSIVKSAYLKEMDQGGSFWVHFEPHVSTLLLTIAGTPIFAQYLQIEDTLKQQALEHDIHTQENLYAQAKNIENLMGVYTNIAGLLSLRLHQWTSTPNINGETFNLSYRTYYTGSIFDLGGETNSLAFQIVNKLNEDFSFDHYHTVGGVQPEDLAGLGLALKHLLKNEEGSFPDFSLFNKNVKTVDSNVVMRNLTFLLPAACALAIIPMWLTQSNQKNQLRETITGHTQTLSALGPYTEEYQRLEDRNREISTVLKLKNAVSRTRIPWNDYLYTLVSFIPTDSTSVRLVNLSLNKPQGTDTIINNKPVTVLYNLKGESKNYGDIIRFIRTFEYNPQFVVQFNSINQQDKTYAFQATIGGVDQGVSL